MAYLTHTISENILQINSPNEINANSLKIYFSPKQDGSGTPATDNIRAITGWTTFDVYSGKNIIPTTAEYGAKNISTTGGLGGSYSYTHIETFIPVHPNTNYTFSFNKTTESSLAVTVPCYDENKNFLQRITGMGTTTEVGRLHCNFLTPSDTYFIRMSFPKSSTQMQLQSGCIATSYTETTPIEVILENTYYYGYIDLVTGQLVKTHGYIEYDGSEDENWTDEIFQNNYNFYITAPSDAKINTTLSDDLICNMSTSSGESLQNNKIKISRAGYFNADIGTALNISSAFDFKVWLSEHPMQVVYKLATPQTIQLTAQQIKILRGTTNIWSTSNGKVEINYNLHQTTEITELKKKIMFVTNQRNLPFEYNQVEFLYRSEEFSGPYCQLNWNLTTGDRVISKALMLGPSGQEAAFGGNGTSSPYLEIYYRKAGTPTSWIQGGTINDRTTIQGIPTEIAFTAGSELLYTYWGAYRPGTYKFRGRLYGLTIASNSGEIKHNLLPCVRNIDNEPGFYDTVQGIFYPNMSDTGTFETPTYIDGICVYKDNAFYSVNSNGGSDQYTEDSNWFIAGPFDTGNSDTKSYTCNQYNGSGVENWLRIWNNINSTSSDCYSLDSTNSSPKTFSSAGRYILVGIYKPNVTNSYIYDNTNQRYIFKGSNVI